MCEMGALGDRTYVLRATWRGHPRSIASNEGRLDLFQNHGNALAHANAHGAQRVAAAQRVQLVYGCGGQARALGAERVAQGHRAAPGIDARVVVLQAQLAQNGQALRGKGFIEFNHIKLLNVHT